MRHDSPEMPDLWKVAGALVRPKGITLIELKMPLRIQSFFYTVLPSHPASSSKPISKVVERKELLGASKMELTQSNGQGS